MKLHTLEGSPKSRIWGKRNPLTNQYQILHADAVQNVIMHAGFCEDRLSGVGVARARMLAFSIDSLRRH